ncbi:profilin-1-like [Engystomops pustulosus]|uniref:profilin-1-like n=1 Tax=Engystomops pustulosus TaxID=76066 RepID=UPI003AFA6DED
MSWQDYIKTLMTAEVQDACICGFEPASVWASEPGMNLGKITAAEIQALVAKDRTNFFINGLTLGGVRCSVIRDNLDDDTFTMDVRTKSDGSSSTYNVAISKTRSALVMVMGKEGVHGGCMNAKAHGMAKYLRDLGM